MDESQNQESVYLESSQHQLNQTNLANQQNQNINQNTNNNNNQLSNSVSSQQVNLLPHVTHESSKINMSRKFSNSINSTSNESSIISNQNMKTVSIDSGTSINSFNNILPINSATTAQKSPKNIIRYHKNHLKTNQKTSLLQHHHASIENLSSQEIIAHEDSNFSRQIRNSKIFSSQRYIRHHHAGLLNSVKTSRHHTISNPAQSSSASSNYVQSSFKIPQAQQYLEDQDAVADLNLKLTLRNKSEEILSSQIKQANSCPITPLSDPPVNFQKNSAARMFARTNSGTTIQLDQNFTSRHQEFYQYDSLNNSTTLSEKFSNEENLSLRNPKLYETALNQAKMILKELIESELSYIKQLEMINDGYIKLFNQSDPNQSSSTLKYDCQQLNNQTISSQNILIPGLGDMKSKTTSISHMPDQTPNIGLLEINKQNRSQSSINAHELKLHQSQKSTLGHGVSNPNVTTSSTNQPEKFMDLPKVPEKLRYKKDEIFSTWESILKFHDSTLKPMIENFLEVDIFENAAGGQTAASTANPNKGNVPSRMPASNPDPESEETRNYSSSGCHEKTDTESEDFENLKNKENQSPVAIASSLISPKQNYSHQKTTSSNKNSNKTPTKIIKSDIQIKHTPTSFNISHYQKLSKYFKNFNSKFKNFTQISDFLNIVFHKNNIEEMEDYYFYYSQNLKKSFKIINSCDLEIKKFFQIVQWKLKNPLPIDAYILIPVQRIAKYPLLMSKFVEIYEEVNDLEVYNDTFLYLKRVSKRINDLR